MTLLPIDRCSSLHFGDLKFRVDNFLVRIQHWKRRVRDSSRYVILYPFQIFLVRSRTLGVRFRRVAPCATHLYTVRVGDELFFLF